MFLNIKIEGTKVPFRRNQGSLELPFEGTKVPSSSLLYNNVIIL